MPPRASAAFTAALALLLQARTLASLWSNWNGEQTCDPVAVVSVSSEADAIAAVTAARARGGGIRVIGRGHSFSPIDLSNGTLIELVPPAVGAVQLLQPNVVRVHAGVHLWELNAALEELGLAMPNLGAISNQTVAGATQTNTHGTGPTGGTSTFVIGARLVLPNATAVTVSATENADLFAAVRTGYGAFGVLVTLDMHVWPLWRMERIVAPVADLSTLLRALPALLLQYERLQWYYTPYTPGATLLIRANTSAPVTGCWAGGASYNAPHTSAPVALGGVWPANTTACTDVSYKTLTSGTDDAFLYTEMEMMVPAPAAADVMQTFIAFQNAAEPSHDASVALFTGVRYVAGDDILLSPFSGRDTAVVSMIVIGNATSGGDQREVRLYDEALQRIAFAGAAARPHPGKVNWFNASMMAAVYPDTFGRFTALRAAVDPDGLFVNDYTARLFGVQAAR